MPNKITYTITTSDGKQHQVSKENVDKYGIQSYADAYKGATIRMRDSKKGDYDIPLSHYHDAKAQGLHAFSLEHLPSAPAKPQPKQQPRQAAPHKPHTTSVSKPTTGGRPMTAAEKAQAMNFVAGIQQGIQRRKQQSDAIMQRAKAQQKNPFNVQRVTLGIGGTKPTMTANKHVVQGENKLNAKTGKLEPTYITEAGNVYQGDRTLADIEQNQIDDAKEAKLHPIDHELKEAYAERKRLARELGRRGTELDAEALKPSWRDMPRGSGGAIHTFNSATSNGRLADNEWKALLAAKNQNQQRIVALEAERDKAEAGFWRGVTDTFKNPSFWTFGYTDMLDTSAMLNYGGKKKQREKYADQAMIENTYKNQVAQNKYGNNRNFMYRAGGITAQAIPFMIEFAATDGLSGLTRAGTKLGTKIAEKVATKALAKKLIKYTGTTLGDIAAGVVMANTTGAARTASDIGQRHLGHVEQDEHGNYRFAGGEDWGTAIRKGEIAQTLEYYTEKLGAHLEGLPIGKTIAKGLDKIGLSKVTAALNRAGTSQYAQLGTKVMNRVGVNGYINEVVEEEANIVLNSMFVGDNKMSDLFDGRTQADIWGGMLFSAGAMEAAPKLAGAVDYYKTKKSVKDADTVAAYRMTQGKWQPLREKIDNATNEEMADVVYGIIQNPNLHEQEKKAALNYAGNLIKFRGFNTAQSTKAKELEETGAKDDETIIHQSMDNAYIQGHEASDEQKNDIKTRYEYTEQQLSEALGTEDVSGYSVDDFLDNKENLNDKQKQAAIDYLNAKSAYNGMISQVKDNIDDAIKASDMAIDNHTHEDGNIYPATMKVDNRKVYVVGGYAQMNDDGTGIDHAKSSESIMVRDAETGKTEMVAPAAILSVDEATNAEEEKANAAESIRQTYAQQEANKIDGTLEFNVGDTYSVIGEDNSQHTLQVIGDAVDEKTGQPIPNMVMVSVDGSQQPTMLPKAQVQEMSDGDNMLRLSQSLKQREEAKAAESQHSNTYSLNDEVTLTNEEGMPVRGSITADQNEDGKFEVYTEEPINGKKVNLFSAEELDALNPDVQTKEETPQTSNNEFEGELAQTESVESAENPQQSLSAFERIPKDEQGQPIYEQAEPETAWDAIVEQTGGDEAMAQTVADDMVADMEAAVKKAGKAKTKGGTTIAEKIAAEKERSAAIEQAKQTLAHWKKIASTNRMRQAAIHAEENRKAGEATRLRKEQEDKERAEREEAERQKREALNGVPDFVEDKASDARARGYRRVNGDKVDRQEPLAAVQGKDVQVKFDDKNIPSGHVALIDADELQPSHKNGQRNPLHFIDEAQPKERKDDASKEAARKIASNIRPEEITSSVTAYTGAPTVNSRGEVIQGNNRSAALKEMWAAHQDQAEKYKQYLIDHAAELGLNPDEVRAMEKPILVNMLDVNDDDAIALGQFVASDTESGGVERIKPKNVVKKLGDKMKNFASLLLRSTDEDMSFSELIDRNGVDVLKWMNSNGSITPTQYKSAFDSRGNLTAEAKNDLKGIMYQSIFEGGSTQLEEMFNALPAKAQKAILATAYRDYDSPQSERMIEELQNSIMAYYALSHDAQFMAATNHKDARMAVESWKRQYAIDDNTGESYLPAEKYSNFALLLVTMYKGDNQSFIQGTFNKMYDLIQGTQEETLFEQPDNTPRTLAEAIKEVLNIDYNGQQRNDVLVGGTTTSQRGEQGSTGDSTTGGRSENSDGTEAHQGGTERESRGNRGQGNLESLAERQGYLGETKEVKISDEVDEDGSPFVKTSTGTTVFGEIKKESGLTPAPIKLSLGNSKYGLIHLEKRHGDQIRGAGFDTVEEFVEFVCKNYKQIKQGENSLGEQNGTYLIQIEDEHNNTLYIELSTDGKYWGVNSGGVFRKGYGKNKKEVWPASEVQSKQSVADSTLREKDKADTPISPNGNVPTTSADKDKQSSDTKQEKERKTSQNNEVREDLFAMAERVAAEDKAKRTRKAEEAKVDINPTDAQKEAGIYTKGHIKVAGMDVTIEQPKGSIRRGKDADGKEWESEMHNTYGYIRGTESVDGDHIDIFLSDTPETGNVFVIDQVNKDGSFDEHKVMYGFSDMESAKKAYLSNYEDGWQGLGNITEVSKEEFKKWIDSSKCKTKPFAEYSSVKTEGDVKVEHPIESSERTKPETKNRLVTDERYEELKKRMKAKLRGQLNMGVDPEMLAIGAEMAVYHIEKGARAFSEYAKGMIADLGDAIRPYLKAFYNGARDLPEMAELSKEMTSYSDVSAFDVATIGNEGEEVKPTVFDTAEQISNEATVEHNAQEEAKQTTETGDVDNDVYSITKQHNNKKDVDIWVVRGKERSDKDVYMQRKQIAKEHDGYYSSFRGVNGFVFNTPEDAQAFAENVFDEQPVGKEVEKPADTSNIPKKINVASLMEQLKSEGKVKLSDHEEPIEEEKGEKTKENQPKSGNQKQNNVSSHVENDLFGGLFSESEPKSQDNEDNQRTRRENRKSDDGVSQRQSSERRTADPEQLDANPTERRTERKGDSGVQSGTTEKRSSDERPTGRLSRLNTTNNHAERGVDYAPISVDARIEANIKAIELANDLVESGEKATPEKMRVLRKFSGWGGLGKAFSIGTPISRKLQQMLGAEAYEQAVMSANSAYYTPAYVIDTLWDVAKQLGFKGGNVLEGSAGIGNIIGQMPMDISDNSHIQAVEIDGTSGNILSLLYPEANVEIQGFEQTRVPNGSVDLAITNVPFVTGLRVNDTTGDSDLSKKFHNIHDFCIAKNVRKLRDGGIGIFISSNGTLDSSQKLRDWLVSDGNADIIGAFRLNNKTFGGTGVTSDIIVIRKRVGGKVSPNAIDVSTVTGERSVDYNTGKEKKVKGTYVPVIKHLSMDYNKYFIEHPEMMAGKMEFAFEHGDTYRATSKGLYPTSDKQQEKMLQDFVNSFAHMKDESQAKKEEKPVNVYEALGDDVKEGSMLINKDGKLCVAQLGQAVPLDLNTNKVKGHTKEECFKAYTAIKKALDDVLHYQSENEDDKGLQPLLDELNKVYDDFVNTYGHLNKNVSIAFLRNDVDYPNVFSLERYEETGDKDGKRVQKFSKTDVFGKRVIEKDVEPQPKNVKDGIIVSIYKTGKIDIPYISTQLSMSEDDVKEEIISCGLGFEDPTSKQVVVSYQYLSGNVREKLKQAEANNENGTYNGNIKALKEVVPNSIPAHLIEFNLGSSWIAPELYNEFVKEKTDIDVKFTAAGGTWFMKAPDWGLNNDKNRTSGVHSEVFNEYIYGHKLIEAAIQNKTVSVSRVQKHYDGSTETITDKEATQACASKIDEIRQDFKDWARNKMQSDPAMSERMEAVYNDLFNNYVPVDIPSEYIPEHFGSATHSITLRPHQAKAVVRGTMQPLMLAHEVGTGKTFTLISTAMEMRRLGTAHKPMIVVQNATVGQFVASAKQLYPNAKILTLEDSDRSAEGRKNFYAKIRYNDWDMIVVPQSTFEFIPDSEERQMAFIKDKIEEKMLVLEKMKEADDSERNPITRQAEKEIQQLEDELASISGQLADKRTAKDEKKRAVTKQNTEVKAREMLDRRTDDTENFDDMGIDALLVDEAHEYKHLGFATAMQRGVKGVDPSYSKKSQGVYLKTQAVLQKNHGRNVIFATGTPISNTAAEIWTFMRYLMPADTMKDYGIYYFDDFVRNFGNIQQMLEFTTSGKFKENNRFAGYIDLPELVRIWSSVSDTVRTKDAGGVSDKIPEMETGKAQDLYLSQTKALRGIMKFVKGELEKYDNMSGKEKKENSHIPLTMYGIAKAAAVDARLVDASAEDDANSKTNEAVRQTLRTLKETADYKGTIAIFADNYQNKTSGFNLYEDVREKLIKAGVPEKQIIVMKSGMTVKKKLEIFDKVNRGEVRVIMGSTFTLGTGVNIQERLHTLIHLDAPNRPMDYTQRNGRILRQGNIHKEMNKPVRVLRFGVEDSLDVTAYQRLKTKGAIADSIMNGKQLMANSMENRILEEEEDAFGDTVAQLSGSEYAMLKNQAEKNARKFESRKRQWEADQTYIHNAKPRLNGQIKQEQERKDTNEKNLSLVRKTYPDGTFKTITIGKQKFDSVEAMADFFKEHNKKVKDEGEKVKDSANASYTSNLNVNIDGLDFVVRTEVAKETTSQGINIFTKATRKMLYSQKELGLTDVPVKNGLLRNAIEDITENVINGNDFENIVGYAEQNIARHKSELEQMQAREGKPFEFEKELEEAKAKYEEYTELMKQEMEEKEKKYAEMDKDVEAVSTLSEASEDEEYLMRDGQGTLTDDELSFINDPWAKMMGKSNRTAKQRAAFAERERSRMTNRVGELADTLHLDNVEVVTDASQLDGKRANAKGFYSKSTGKITIVIPNHANIADVEKTLLHEAVAHYGLRKLFGDHFDTFLDNVYQNAEPEIRREIVKLATKNGWDFRTATEEYLASLAEQTDFERMPYSFWTKIKQLFMKLLHSIGFENWQGGELSDNELRYILWRSYQNLKEPGRYRSILGEAEDVAKQYELKVGNYAEQTEVTSDEVAEASVGFDEVNERFNDALQQQIDGTLPKGYVYDLGMPSSILLSTGIPNLPIELVASRLSDKSMQENHPFDLNEVKDLPNAIQNPFAVFRSATHIGSNVILTNLKHGGRNYVVAIETNRKAGRIFVNSVRSVHYRNSMNIIGWINDGLADYMSEDFRNSWIEETKNELLSKPQYNSADVRKKLISVANIVKDFENPNISEENVEEDDVLFREGEDSVDARDIYEHRVSRAMFQTQEALQDSMLGLKEAMEAVLKAEGTKTDIADIAGFENAYLGENRLSSVNKAEADAFAHLVFKPMLDEVAKLSKNEQECVELVDYMMAKHGLERNEVMAERDATEAFKANEQAHPNSTKSFDDYLADARQRDYAGLTALTGTDTVEDAEAEAGRMVADYEQNNDTTALWKKVNDVTNATLSKSYECGMMNKDTYDKIKSMYQFYIPLRGFDEKTSGEAYAYLTHRQSAFNAPIKVARGRTSKADDPFANMQSMAESAITQGNRNKLVKQKFLNFALNHPSDLVSVSDLWLKYDDVTDEWKPVFPNNIEDTDSADDIEKKLQDFEARMEELAEKEPEKYKHGKDTINVPYRVVESRDLKQHQVLVKRGGRDYVLTINGNPRAAQALNGQTNPDNDNSGPIGAILKVGEMVNRQLSAFYTTRNPDFVVSNFIRDMLYANSMVWVKESPNYALRFHRNIGRCNPVQVKILLTKHINGKLNMDNDLERSFYQFMMNGGETGYANMRDIEQHKNDIRRELKRANGKLGITKAINLLGERLDEYNRAVENSARFAAFLTSREMGRTIDRSIYDAKEISVNFNKKGSGAKFMGAVGQTKLGNTSAFLSGLGRSGFVFWNAAIQGTTNFGRQFKKYPAKAFTAAATMFILGALVAGMGMGDGDDDNKNSYWNLPEYVRRSNILFKAGDQWVSIPLPTEYRAIYGMGELMVSAMSGKEHFTNEELGRAIAGQATQILPIDFLEGEGGLKAFIPSAAKPFAEVYTNKSWTGMPIYKDTPYNKDMPEWTKAYKSANKYLLGLSKLLNEATRGDAYTKGAIDLNPAKIEYILNGYFGGVSNTIDKLTKSAETIAGQREYDPRSFLVLNRILKNGDERTESRAINNEYYRAKEEHDKLKARIKHYEKDTDNGVFDYAEKIDFLYNSLEYARYEIFEDYNKEIDGLYAEMKEATDDDERKVIDNELTALKKQMIEEMNATRK
jgi:N12 class adenine-specific DNA methylase